MTARALRPTPVWLGGLCADGTRGDIARPFTTTFAGAPCVCATNGHIIVILRDAYDAPPSDIARAVIDRVRNVSLRPGRRVRLDALRAFCEVERHAGDVPPCDACGARRWVECPNCDDGAVTCDYGHEHECRMCDGGGAVPCRACGVPPVADPHSDRTPAWLAGVYLNRVLLATALPFVTGEFATWHPSGNENAASVLASVGAEPAWVVAIMPLRDGGAWPDAPVFDAWKPDGPDGNA